jgi:hypothetical protein
MEKRLATRSAVCDLTEARVRFKEVLDPGGGSAETVIRGRVDNLGSKGMFLKTTQPIPAQRELSIRILFEPRNPCGPVLEAKGRVIRSDGRGVAIQFTQIDLNRLGECILQVLGNDAQASSAAGAPISPDP